MREVLVKNEEFKDSPLGKIPKDWDVVNLGSVLTLLYRYPTYYGIKYVEKGVPEIRGELILDDGRLEERFELYRYVSESTANRFHKVKLEPGDFVMSVRGTMGKVSVVPDALKGAVITANLIRIQFNQLLVLSQYARHFLSSDIFQNQLDLETSATTIKTIQVPVLSSIILRLPPIPEQQRIAEILDTVDEAIARTSSLIIKLKQTKAGLLQDLLTRGLDENGKLRDPQAHPEHFKDSLLGKIPKDWEVGTCESVCKEIVVGIVIRPSQYYKPSGVPVLRSANVREAGLDPSDLVFMSEQSNRILAKSMIRTGDVLTVRTGYPGTSCVVSPDFDGANCVDIIISRPSAEIDSAFLATWINSDSGKGQVLRVQGGLAQQHFNVGELQKLLIAKPSIEKQRAIQAILDTHDTRIRAEEAYLNKLKLQKQGLMQDLLTGKVRVSTIR